MEKCLHRVPLFILHSVSYVFKACKRVHTAKHVKDFNFYPSLNKVSGSRIFVTLFS